MREALGASKLRERKGRSGSACVFIRPLKTIVVDSSVFASCAHSYTCIVTGRRTHTSLCRHWTWKEFGFYLRAALDEYNDQKFARAYKSVCVAYARVSVCTWVHNPSVVWVRV